MRQKSIAAQSEFPDVAHPNFESKIHYLGWAAICVTGDMDVKHLIVGFDRHSHEHAQLRGKDIITAFARHVYRVQTGQSIANKRFVSQNWKFLIHLEFAGTLVEKWLFLPKKK